MESLAEVREDLRDIRYYYAHKEMFDKTVDVTGEHELIRKAERYNAAMCTAPPRLYEVYVGLYSVYSVICRVAIFVVIAYEIKIIARIHHAERIDLISFSAFAIGAVAVQIRVKV